MSLRSTTVESVKNYMASSKAQSDQLLFGIFLSKTKNQMGTIKLEPINLIHARINRYHDWRKDGVGKGYGTRSVAY